VQKDVGTHLATLARKRFVRPGGADRTNGGAAATGGWFRFDHILIRDATYETLLKRARATLHERFVEWADRVNGDRVQEYEEILGYHLEQAYRYLGELGPLDEHGLGVGADAARRLSSAGRRAMRRGDAAAAANLLERAAALLPELDPGRIELLPDLGETLVQLGRFAEADAVLRDASDAAVAASEVRLQARASLVRLLVRLRTGDADEWADAAVAEVDDAIEVFEEAGDHAGVAKALRVIGHVHGNACRYGEAAAAAERALTRAKRAGDAREYASNATTYALAAMLGPTPVPDAIRVCEQTIGDLAENRSAQGVVYCLVGPLHAMRGDFDRARELWARGRTAHEELGVQWLVARVMLEAARVEMLADDPAAAESRLRAGLELCELIGERYARSTMTALLGRAVAAQGRLDEADDLSATAEELAGRDDVVTQSLWRCVRANVWARRGRIDDAMVLVQEALQLVLPTDSAVTKVDVLLDLGDVSKYADDRAAAWAFQEAATLAQLKGNVVTAAAARRRLLAVGDPAQTRG
jgi:tetratricopeptide (TPR) repeat protein